jgi:predicted kinase
METLQPDAGGIQLVTENSGNMNAGSVIFFGDGIPVLGEEYSAKSIPENKRIELAEEILLNCQIIPRQDVPKTFVVFTGIPGTGKTTVSGLLRNRFGFNPIATDGIKRFLLATNTQFVKDDLFAIQKLMFRSLFSAGVNVVSDSGSNMRQYRIGLLEMGKAYGYNIINVNLLFEPEICLQRVYARDYITDPELMKKWRSRMYEYYHELEPPTEAECFGSILTIDGTQDPDRVREDLFVLMEQELRLPLSPP